MLHNLVQIFTRLYCTQQEVPWSFSCVLYVDHTPNTLLQSPALTKNKNKSKPKKQKQNKTVDQETKKESIK